MTQAKHKEVLDNPLMDVFEKNASSFGFDTKKDSESRYNSQATRCAWDGWKMAYKYYCGRTEMYF